jgi:hypothetical protein
MSMRQHTSASAAQHTSAYVSIRQHQQLSIRQHTSACGSISSSSILSISLMQRSAILCIYTYNIIYIYL